jgi:hypothetical protein
MPAKKTTAKSAAKKAVKPASRFLDTAKITLLAKENPCRTGSKVFKRFAKYRNGMTVAAAKEAGLFAHDFRRDIGKGYISIA